MRRLLAILLTAALPALAGEGSRRDMAATANPLATEAALEALRAGGTAVDAAVAAQAMLSVVEPHASGLLGGAVLLVWDATERRLRHYEGISGAPAAATGSLLLDADGTRLEERAVERTGRAVGVPGAVAALALAHREHGRLPWASLFEPAIRAAEQGFAMPPYLHAVLREAAPRLLERPGFETVFFRDGAPVPVGGTVRNPEQARALRMVAARGLAALHDGPFAEAVVAAAQSGPHPGLLTEADLRDYQPQEREPLCAQAFGRRVCTAAPPSSGGVAMLQVLGLLDRTGFGRTEPGSVAAAHLLIEASRLARADRVRWVGDPRFVAVPDRLVAPGYLDQRAALVGPRAMPSAPAGTAQQLHAAMPAPEAAPLSEPATSHISVVDAQGGAVTLTTTNNLNFGARLMAMGVVLNNGLTNFAGNPEGLAGPAQNRMEPRKRPATTMAPTIVFGTDGQPEIVIGAGGGAWIPDAVAGAIAEMLAWNRSVAEAVARPRLGTGLGGRVQVEAGTAATALEPALRALGHEIEVRTINTGLQAIRRLTGGALEGAADPRRDGTAR